MANLDVTPDFTAAGVVTPGAGRARITGIVFPPALVQHGLEQRRPSRRHGVPAGAQAPCSTPATASRTTRRRTPRSAQKLVAQPPFADTVDEPRGARRPAYVSESGCSTGRRRRRTTSAIDPRYGLGMIQTWNATVSRDVLAHLDRHRRLHRHDAARAWICCGRRIATPTARCASTACSRSSGNRRAGTRCCRSAASPFQRGLAQRHSLRRQLHAGQVDGQRVVARRRRRGGRAERPGPRGGVCAVELRSAASSSPPTSCGSCRSASAGSGSRTAGFWPRSSASGR